MFGYYFLVKMAHPPFVMGRGYPQLETEIDKGDQFWIEKNDSGHKTQFLMLNPFSGGK